MPDFVTAPVLQVMADLASEKKRQVRVELGPTRDRIQVLYRGRP